MNPHGLTLGHQMTCRIAFKQLSIFLVVTASQLTFCDAIPNTIHHKVTRSFSVFSLD